MSDVAEGRPASATPGLKGEVTRAELTRHERLIARRSAEVRAIVPDVEYTAVVEMTAAEARAAALGVDVRALVLAAVGAALRAVPRVNGAYRDGHYELHARVNVAVTFGGGGVYASPTVFDADAKDPAALDAELADYARRAASDALASAELTGATFTFSPPPRDGIIVSATPLIMAPQAAALAAGAIRDEPVVRDGAVAGGRTMVLTLACDQRIVHSDHAAAFLTAIRDGLAGAGTR